MIGDPQIAHLMIDMIDKMHNDLRALAQRAFDAGVEYERARINKCIDEVKLSGHCGCGRCECTFVDDYAYVSDIQSQVQNG